MEIATDSRIDDVAALRRDGFDAVLVATGTHKSVSLRVPGEDLEGVQSALEFLRAVKLGEAVDLAGKRVLVVGGGNVAIDAARTARRLGAASVDQVSLECCEEMPAHDFEVEEARAEGITLHDGWGIDHFTGEGRVQGAAAQGLHLRVRPRRALPAPSTTRRQHKSLECDVVIVAAGMGADTAAFGLETNGNAHPQGRPRHAADRRCRSIFAAGDVVTGPTMITSAVGQGRRAAFMIDRYLQGAELDPDAFDEATAGRRQDRRARPAGRV